jgi:hypothetical protein
VHRVLLHPAAGKKETTTRGEGKSFEARGLQPGSLGKRCVRKRGAGRGRGLYKGGKRNEGAEEKRREREREREREEERESER